MSIEKTAKQEISSLAAVLIRCKSTLHSQSLSHGYGYCSFSAPTAFGFAELETLSGEQLVLADANGDNEINIADATHLQILLAEYEVELR